MVFDPGDGAEPPEMVLGVSVAFPAGVDPLEHMLGILASEPMLRALPDPVLKDLAAILNAELTARGLETTSP